MERPAAGVDSTTNTVGEPARPLYRYAAAGGGGGGPGANDGGEGAASETVVVDVSVARRKPLSRAKCFLGDGYGSKHSKWYLQVRTMERDVSPSEVLEAIAANQKPPTGRYDVSCLIHEYEDKTTGQVREFVTNFPLYLLDGLGNAIATIRHHRRGDGGDAGG